MRARRKYKTHFPALAVKALQQLVVLGFSQEVTMQLLRAKMLVSIPPGNSFLYESIISCLTSIYLYNRAECKEQVQDGRFAKYKKFPTLEEAEQFIQENKGSQFSRIPPVPHDRDICAQNLSSVSFRDHRFQQDENGYVHCYTDGSCESNGQVRAKAGIGVWFGVDHPL